MNVVGKYETCLEAEVTRKPYPKKRTNLLVEIAHTDISDMYSTPARVVRNILSLLPTIWLNIYIYLEVKKMLL